MICLLATGYAQMYKCKRPDGSIAYQDSECPVGAVSTKMAVRESPSAQTLTLTADGYGHYRTQITINGVQVEGLIDTGASLVTVSTGTARSMGISLTSGTRQGAMQTANGIILATFKRVPVVRIGNIDLYDVEICITDNTPNLVGMSALRRFRISQENGQMLMQKQ